MSYCRGALAPLLGVAAIAAGLSLAATGPAAADDEVLIYNKYGPTAGVSPPLGPQASEGPVYLPDPNTRILVQRSYAVIPPTTRVYTAPPVRVYQTQPATTVYQTQPATVYETAPAPTYYYVAP
jgi:hypothetical protein